MPFSDYWLQKATTRVLAALHKALSKSAPLHYAAILSIPHNILIPYFSYAHYELQNYIRGHFDITFAYIILLFPRVSFAYIIESLIFW